MDQTLDGSFEPASTPFDRPWTGRIALMAALIGLVGWSLFMLRDRVMPGRAESKLLKQGNLRERRKAARLLASMPIRGYDRAAESLSTALLNDTDGIVRSEAARSIGLATDELLKQGDRSESLSAALEALIRGLGDVDPNVRENSAHSLGVFGRWTESSPDLLAKLAATDPEPEVRGAAAGAIGRFKSAGPESVRRLFQGMEGGPGSTQRTCSNTLGQINPTPESVPDLVERLAHPQPEIRCRAADLLARLGEASVVAVPALTANLSTPVPVRPRSSKPQDSTSGFDPANFSAVALSRIAPGTKYAKSVVEALVKNLREEETLRVEAAAQSLVAFGPDAAVAVPPMIEALTRLTTPPHTGEGASALAGALGELAPATPHADAAVAVLTRALGSRSEFTRARSANALARFGAKAVSALPQVESLQRDGSLAVRFEAARTLAILAAPPK